MRYKYRAKAQGGALMTGIRDVEDQTAMLQWIRNQGWSPVSIEKEKNEASSLLSLNIELPQKVTIKDKSVLFRQIATMVGAGVTIASSLELLSTQTANPTLRKAVVSVKNDVGSGITMAQAMKKHPKIFGTLETSLIHAGEEGGVLEISLDRLATFLEAQDSLRKKVKSAMTYPVVVIIITILVLGLMTAIVVPQFKTAYGNLGITEDKMPALTRYIFALADFLRTGWFLVPLPALGVYGLWVLIGKLPGGKKFQDTVKIKAPVTGDIAFKVIITRTFRTLATLVNAGVPILEALDMSAAVADNVIVTSAFLKIKEKAQNGMPLNTTMKELPVFPAMVGHMVAVGEETGRIDEMLDKIAEWYNTELEEKIKGLTSIIEPVLIVIVGIGVGLVVGSVFIPLIGAMQNFM